MNMSAFKSFFLTILILISYVSYAQEVLLPLATNPVISKEKLPKHLYNAKITLNLPFIDDFSDGLWYPNPSRWQDAMVFINHDYAVDPPSIGVATFDALDQYGRVYSNATSFPFPADTLTSHNIDLSHYKQSDSIYMSFFYQPAGIGNAPERNDSLLLEFWSESRQAWLHVWAAPGTTLSDFKAQTGKYFDMVILPIDSALFFSGMFKFRFRNYASITDISLPDWGGNVDIWNVDYIVINTNRSIHDTLIRNDRAFRDYPKSMLHNYYSMPWNQYLANPAAETKHEVSVPYSSYFHDTIFFINQNFHVLSLTGGTSYEPTPHYNYGNLPMPIDTVVIPRPGTGFDNYLFDAPSYPYADFELVAWIQPFLKDTITTNDTVRFYQRFYNYYAYDDGTPEAGYGLSASNPNIVLSAALRFDLNVPDTLRAVQIFFNETKDLANEDFFTLTIWEVDGNVPGDTLYTQEELRPVFIEGLNQYTNYVLSRPVPVSGSFFVGWTQTSGTMLHLGFDKNNDSRENLFFNIGTGWNQSQFEGALMIRPVLGDTSEPYVSTPELPAKKEQQVTLYPNPASNIINIKTNNINPFEDQKSSDFKVEIYNANGQLVLNEITYKSINVSSLPDGLYFVRVSNANEGTLINTSRIIINNR